MTSRKAHPAGGLTASPVRVGAHERTLQPWIVKAAAILTLAFVIMAALTRIAAAQSDTWAKILREGAEEYKESCAACHGDDAKGRGELGQKLFKKPNDLTEIAKRNDGAFPFRRVFDIIAGDQLVEGHDTMHMPKYSERMKGEDFQPGYHRAHLRILELSHYLESIQVK
jgi:mono/diheme cytochrome c family protein